LLHGCTQTRLNGVIHNDMIGPLRSWDIVDTHEVLGRSVEDDNLSSRRPNFESELECEPSGGCAGRPRCCAKAQRLERSLNYLRIGHNLCATSLRFANHQALGVAKRQ